MVKICYIILSHENPHHVGRLANTLVAGDPDGRVVIHYDANSSAANFATLKELVAPSGRVDCLETRERCGWGDFSLVQATINALVHIRATGGCDRVVLISGACLPNRPLADLKAFLATHSDGEFIEVHSSDWIVGGLRDERYRFYHLVNQRRWRRTFQWMARIQKWVRVKRAYPAGMVPRFGSQWWALTWPTLEKVLELIEKDPAIVAFYRKTWIPDELFFQTIVHHLVPSSQIRNRSLTFYHFNDWGMPQVFLNDHAELVKALPFYFVRKICHRADTLRDELCRNAIEGDVSDLVPVDPARKPDFPARALAGRDLVVKSGHTRLFNRLDPQSGDFAMTDHGKPFVILYGPPALTRVARRAIENVPGFATLGRLFQDQAIDFGYGRSYFNGMWHSAVAIRDTYPMTWLKMVLSRVEGIPVFEMSPRDKPDIQRSLAQSSHAIFVPIVPREPSPVVDDLYRLLLSKPSDIGEMQFSSGGLEYVRRQRVDAERLDRDVEAALAALSAMGGDEPLAGQRDMVLRYRHGTALDAVIPALAFVNASLTTVTAAEALADYPESVRMLFHPFVSARPLWRATIGLDLPHNAPVLDARARLAVRIAKKPK